MNFLTSFSKLVSCKELWEFDQNWGEVVFFPLSFECEQPEFYSRLASGCGVSVSRMQVRITQFWFAKLLYLLHLFPSFAP